MKDEKTQIEVENKKQKKCRAEFKEKEDLFIEMRSMSNTHIKQEQMLLQSERIFLKNKCEKIDIREEELKDKEEKFEEMKRIGEACEISCVRKDELKEQEDISMIKESVSKQERKVVVPTEDGL